MATQYEPIVKDSTLNTTEQTPRNIADVLADETGDLVTQATAIVTKLQALINAVKPNASDIPLDPITGMSATNVQSGISELKGTLDDLKKSVTLTTTTNTNGSFNIDMNPTNKIIITMLPVRNDANYYQNQFYVTYSTNASFSGYVGNCKDVNLNNLASQDVKIIVYYYDFS